MIINDKESDKEALQGLILLLKGLQELRYFW